MKLSVLLPTRNRLDLLKLAIESVRMQDYSDWEIIVSDNASDDDIGAYIKSLEDPRIHCRRFEQLVPVTDNWNAALELATGEYVIMLGDDDALVPCGLSQVRALAQSQPDAIYAQAMQYAYPDVIPEHPQPFLQTGINVFLEGRKEAFDLARAEALELVRAAMGFRILYGFNMQHFAVSRRLVEKLRDKGPFFQSPYPDYYAANAVLLAAETLRVSPRPFALIGISPKSFGFYYFNKREDDGVAFLKNLADPDIAMRLRGEIVPGSNMNDSWLCSMQTLARNFPTVVGSQVNFARYRRLQHHRLLKAGRYGALLRCLRLWEYPLYGAATLAIGFSYVLTSRFGAGLRRRMIDALFSPAPRFDPRRVAVPYRDILEAARAEST